MACTRKTKTLVSTCVILSGMTNIVCLLYVGWVTNYIANIYIKVPMPVAERKLEGDKRGDTVRIMERLDRLENVVNQHIQGKASFPRPSKLLIPVLHSYRRKIKKSLGLVFEIYSTGISPFTRNECKAESGSDGSSLKMWNCAFCAGSADIHN